MSSAQDVLTAIREQADEARARVSRRYFKTGPGEYGADDQFAGLTVPIQRRLANEFRTLPLPEIRRLLSSKIHEARFIALVIMVHQFQRGNEGERQAIVDLYQQSTDRINNWDLVDTSAPQILGTWLLNHSRTILDQYARSENLWQRRIAILATQAMIRNGEYDDTLRLATILLDDRHDLIHKAVGWMLREVGQSDQRVLLDFLEVHTARMPRTMLRYAIEKFSPEERQIFLRRPRDLQGAKRSS